MAGEDTTLPAPKESTPQWPDLIPSADPQMYHTSFAFILEHGATLSKNSNNIITFNRNASDPTATAYRHVRDLANRAIVAHPEIKTLPQEQYEHLLASITLDTVQGSMFAPNHYQNDGETSLPGTRNLNQFHTGDTFDCEHLSLTHGLLMQEADKHAVTLGLRQHSTPFYYMKGAGTSRANPDDVGGHAFIASAATGNIIEATATHDAYRKTPIDFTEMVAGYPALTEKYMYTTNSFLKLDEATIAQRHQLLKENPAQIEKLHSLSIDTATLAEPDDATREKIAARVVKKEAAAVDLYCALPDFSDHPPATPKLKNGCPEEVHRVVTASIRTTDAALALANRYVSETKFPVQNHPAEAAAVDKSPLVSASHIPEHRGR